MRRSLLRAWLAATLGLAALVGCQTTNRKPPHPDDPLLLSKKAVDGKPTNPPTNLVARVEPAMPQWPTSLLAAQSPPLAPVPPPSEPFQAGPSTRPRVPATLASRRRVVGTHGHAADFSWLQGVLEQATDGPLYLRYVAPDHAGAGPALVILEDDPRLAAFRPGDVILVEGDGEAEVDAAAPRRYRVRSVWLVRRGE